MSKKYRIQPLLLGEADVGCILDVFWSLTTDASKVTVPVFAFLIEGGPAPVLVDSGMRSAERAMQIHKLGPHRMPVTCRSSSNSPSTASNPKTSRPSC